MRRERIYPFRNVGEHRSSLDGYGFQFFPTIIHSTYLGKNVADVECINAFPTKRINIFRFNAPAQNHYPDGMHKCIPYELSIDKRTILLRKADIQIIKFLPCWVKPICTKQKSTLQNQDGCGSIGTEGTPTNGASPLD